MRREHDGFLADLPREKQNEILGGITEMRRNYAKWEKTKHIECTKSIGLGLLVLAIAIGTGFYLAHWQEERQIKQNNKASELYEQDGRDIKYRMENYFRDYQGGNEK